MDNPTNTPGPQEAAGATAASGQPDVVATQPTETVTPTSDGTSADVGASNPWDNDPKFKGKSPEDIYKAYTEVEKLNGQLGQKAQIANLIEQKYGVTPEQLKAQIEQQEQQQKQEFYKNNPLAPLVEKVQTLEQQLQLQEVERARALEESKLDEYLKTAPEYAPHRDKILKLGLTPGIGFNPETGDEVSYAELAKEWIGEIRAQGQTDAYNRMETKIMTQATGAGTGESQRAISLEDMKNMSVAELEKILPHA